MNNLGRDEELRDIVGAFRNRLTVEEKAKLLCIRNEISRHTRWTKLAEYFINIMCSVVEAGLFYSSKPADWLKPAMQEGFSPMEERFLFSGGRSKIRHRYLTLATMLKLVGRAKQILKNRLADLEPFAPKEEGEIFTEMEVLQGKGPMSDDDLLDIIDRTLQEPIAMGPPKHVKQKCTHQQSWRKYEYTREGDTKVRTEKCGFCGHIVSRVHTEADPRLKKHEHDPRWVEGKEGKSAICITCKEVIEDPSIYDWERAGLEPYGDDPSKDEIIILEEQTP